MPLLDILGLCLGDQSVQQILMQEGGQQPGIEKYSCDEVCDTSFLIYTHKGFSITLDPDYRIVAAHLMSGSSSSYVRYSGSILYDINFGDSIGASRNKALPAVPIKSGGGFINSFKTYIRKWDLYLTEHGSVMHCLFDETTERLEMITLMLKEPLSEGEGRRKTSY